MKLARDTLLSVPTGLFVVAFALALLPSPGNTQEMATVPPTTDPATTTPDATPPPVPATVPSSVMAPAAAADAVVPNDDPTAAPETATATDNVAQAEALGYLAAIDRHLIAVAKQARGKQLDPMVSFHATVLHMAHSKNLADIESIAQVVGIRPVDTTDIATYRNAAASELTRLGALGEDAYASGFLDAMIRTHTDTLALLDSRLLPAAADDRVKRLLEATRLEVAAELGKAQELRSSGK